MKKKQYKEIRKFLNMTQLEIAEAIGMSNQTNWQAVESGVVNLADKFKITLNNKFKISYKFMIEGKGPIIDDANKSEIKKIIKQLNELL